MWVCHSSALAGGGGAAAAQPSRAAPPADPLCRAPPPNAHAATGSERIHGGALGGSNAVGVHLKEAVSINKSLTTLGRVIMVGGPGSLITLKFARVEVKNNVAYIGV